MGVGGYDALFRFEVVLGCSYNGMQASKGPPVSYRELQWHAYYLLLHDVVMVVCVCRREVGISPRQKRPGNIY